MAFDGIVTTAVTKLQRQTDRRKNRQDLSTVVRRNFHQRTLRERKIPALSLPANTNHAGIYLTEEKSVIPRILRFCMLLRKHLQSARIREIRQVDSERIVELSSRHRSNKLGFSVKTPPHHRNHGKTQQYPSGRYIQRKNRGLHIKRISVDVNRYRQTLPGLLYVAPPTRRQNLLFRHDTAAV